MTDLVKVFILLLVSTSALAQSVPQLLREADKNFENTRYLEAIPYYKKVYGIDKKNYYAGFQLADCYKEALQYREAEKRFKSLSEIQGHNYQARAVYEYATLLKLESRFDEADSIYQELVKMPLTTAELMGLARRQREGCLLAKRRLQKAANADIVELASLNGKFHDFGAAKNKATGMVVFATTRNLSGEQYKDNHYSGMLPDLVAYEQRSNGSWRSISGRQNFNKLNSKWAEGSGCFSSDGQSFYFTSCQGQQGTDCQIMVSYLVADRWSEPIVLNENINEAGAENKQPSLSYTGDTLFFVSNRPGGIGGSDIWMSLKGDSVEAWTPAINMGNVINTPENEITPYYSSANGSLLFSSNGHIGYGGYDIYGAKGRAFFKPDLFNLGAPFNSTWDDTYFSIADSTGFFSTNREDKETLDLYSFKVPNENLYLSLLYAGEMLIDGQVISRFRDTGSLDLVTLRAEDYEGYALFQPIKSTKKDLRKMFADKDGSSSLTLNTSKKIYRSGKSFEQIYFDYDLSELRSEAKRALDDFYLGIKNKPYTTINLLAYADNIGTPLGNANLSRRRGNSVKDYLVSKGIPEDKIKVLARGEIPLEPHEDHWFRRVFSRRVELHIDASQPLRLPVAEGVIVRRAVTMDKVSKELDIPTTDLYNWNGKSKKNLSPGTTIRLYVKKDTKINSELFITQENISQVFQ